jgi:hypothetical protein
VTQGQPVRQGLGRNGWVEPPPAKPDTAPVRDKPLDRPSFDLSPPVVPSRPSLDKPSMPAISTPVGSPQVLRTKTKPSRTVAGKKDSEVAVSKSDDGFARVCVYVASAHLDRLRDLATAESMLMNVCVAERAAARADDVVALARAETAVNRTARRRRLQRVINPVRKVFTFTSEELERIDTLAKRCGWSRSQTVSALISLS